MAGVFPFGTAETHGGSMEWPPPFFGKRGSAAKSALLCFSTDFNEKSSPGGILTPLKNHGVRPWEDDIPYMKWKRKAIEIDGLPVKHGDFLVRYVTHWWTNITMERSTMLLMGKSTISMVIFHCYVSLPEGRHYQRGLDPTIFETSWNAGWNATDMPISPKIYLSNPIYLSHICPVKTILYIYLHSSILVPHVGPVWIAGQLRAWRMEPLVTHRLRTGKSSSFWKVSRRPIHSPKWAMASIALELRESTSSPGWWFQSLWRIWVRQLGWWHSQLKIHVPNHQPLSFCSFQVALNKSQDILIFSVPGKRVSSWFFGGQPSNGQQQSTLCWSS